MKKLKWKYQKKDSTWYSQTETTGIRIKKIAVNFYKLQYGLSATLFFNKLGKTKKIAQSIYEG